LHYSTLHQAEKHLPTPTITLGFIIATLLGALFHFILGGDVRRLALFLLSSWVGFGIGHLVGVLLASVAQCWGIAPITRLIRSNHIIDFCTYSFFAA
jgi:hypothetical protein